MSAEGLWLLMRLAGDLIALWALVRVFGLAWGWWGWDNEKKDWTDGE